MELTSEVLKQYDPIVPALPSAIYLPPLFLSSTLDEPPWCGEKVRKCLYGRVVVGLRLRGKYFQVYISPTTPKSSTFFSLYPHINIQGEVLIGLLGSEARPLGQSLCSWVGLSAGNGSLSESCGMWEGQCTKGKAGRWEQGVILRKKMKGDIGQSNKTQINMYLLYEWKTIVFLRLHTLSQNLSMNFWILPRIIDLEFEAMEKAIWINLLILVGNLGPGQEINFLKVTQLT